MFNFLNERLKLWVIVILEYGWKGWPTAIASNLSKKGHYLIPAR